MIPIGPFENFASAARNYEQPEEPKVLADGSTIEGDLTGGTGIGTRIFKSGHIWSGELHLWWLNGQGEHIFPDGTRYKGTFVNSELHGEGMIINPNGEITDEGIFKHGVMTHRKV